MMESVVASLPMWAILWPVVLLGVCLLPGSGARFTPWLVSAPVPAVLAAVFAGGHSLALSPSAAMPITLAVDAPGAVLLGVSALLWAAAASGLPYKLAQSRHRRRFSVCWLLTMTGNLGVFLAADVMGFFFFYALASLPAYGLVIHEETPQAKHAGKVYLAFALVGEALLLIGLVLLALNPAGGGYPIADAVAGLGESPWRLPTILFLLAAFGLKIGLVPAHGWLPLAHTVAPSPASAVLSGAILNVGVIGIIRFLPFDAGSPAAVWLVALGFTGAFFGVGAGLTRSHPKAILAYSSVSQMGFIAAVCGMAMMRGDASVLLPLAFYAAHHTLVKGGLFLAAGWGENIRRTGFAWWMTPLLLIGLGLGGLPVTGGWLAKLAVKDFFENGWPAWLAMGSSAATACLMTVFAFRLGRGPGNGASLRGAAAWLLLAAAAVALPWALHTRVNHIVLEKAFATSELWKAAWPVVLGALPGVWLGMLPGAAQAAGGANKAADGLAVRFIKCAGASLESGERFLRRWTAGGVMLAALVIVLAIMLFYLTP
jgi:formate hydrogenlyase subunit 3/multisubunit Na+/H+ antiporter MnhD subunit